jgi:hypothetical protein
VLRRRELQVPGGAKNLTRLLKSVLDLASSKQRSSGSILLTVSKKSHLELRRGVITYCPHVFTVGMDQAEFVIVDNSSVESANRPR